MRGDDQQTSHLFSCLSPEQRVPADHPLRLTRAMTDEALRRLSPKFEAVYVCSTATLRAPFLKTSSRRREASDCCRTSTSPSMARCWKRGLVRRVARFS